MNSDPTGDRVQGECYEQGSPNNNADDVKKIQTLLKSLGYIGCNGNTLDVDGIVGNQTWSSMFPSDPSNPTNPTNPTDPTNPSDPSDPITPQPELKPETSSFGSVGCGLQIELDLGPASGGIELVWYPSSQVQVGSQSRFEPYVYLYGGVGPEFSSLDGMVSKIIKSPSLLARPKSLFGENGMSISVFAVFGYSNFRAPSDYDGMFDTASVTVWNVKSYVSWGTACADIGVGWNSTPFSASVSATWYFSSDQVFDYCSKLLTNIQNQTKGLKAPHPLPI
jgi:hypothetical protein